MVPEKPTHGVFHEGTSKKQGGEMMDADKTNRAGFRTSTIRRLFSRLLPGRRMGRQDRGRTVDEDRSPPDDNSFGLDLPEEDRQALLDWAESETQQ